MTRLVTILFCLFLLVPVIAQETEPPVTPIPTPVQPIPDTQSNSGYTLERFFTSLEQGQLGVLRLTGDNIVEARALLRGDEYHFINKSDGWYALMVADIDAQPRDYGFSVVALLEDGSTINFDWLVTITTGGFIRQVFEVPATLAYLTDPIVERDEFAQIEAVTANITPIALWGDAGWQLPLSSPFTSGFGQYRILNQSVQTRHTGWDQRAFVGTPVTAMANGEVVFARQLAIRGNYVLVNHGWGIYTGYAHLSEITVQRGDTVTKGQILGLSGNTGRSNGPHLHWEVKVNGEWVNGALLLDTWLPE